jgi:hypothetical protein
MSRCREQESVLQLSPFRMNDRSFRPEQSNQVFATSGDRKKPKAISIDGLSAQPFGVPRHSGKRHPNTVKMRRNRGRHWSRARSSGSLERGSIPGSYHCPLAVLHVGGSLIDRR